MTSNNLVPVFTGQLQDQPTQLCNARDLHAVLESGQDFSDWIKNRIEKYGFTEGEDFSINLGKTSRRGGRPAEVLLGYGRVCGRYKVYPAHHDAGLPA